MNDDHRGGAFRLAPCGRDGHPIGFLGALPPEFEQTRAATAAFYDQVGFEPPWIGYFAVDDGTIVGGGAFVGPPRDNRVEIAYFTLPRHQRLGHAARTAAALVAIARAARPDIELYAKTAPEDGPSPAILARLGFRRTGVVADHEIGEAWAWLLG